MAKPRPLLCGILPPTSRWPDGQRTFGDKELVNIFDYYIDEIRVENPPGVHLSHSQTCLASS